jgi:hypothetical protein
MGLLVPAPRDAKCSLRNRGEHTVLRKYVFEAHNLARRAYGFDHNRAGTRIDNKEPKRRRGLEYWQLCRHVAAHLEERDGATNTIEGGKTFDPIYRFESEQQTTNAVDLVLVDLDQGVNRAPFLAGRDHERVNPDSLVVEHLQNSRVRAGLKIGCHQKHPFHRNCLTLVISAQTKKPPSALRVVASERRSRKEALHTRTSNTHNNSHGIPPECLGSEEKQIGSAVTHQFLCSHECSKTLILAYLPCRKYLAMKNDMNSRAEQTRSKQPFSEVLQAIARIESQRLHCAG